MTDTALGEQVVLVPATKAMRLVLEVCRQDATRQPFLVVDGVSWYRFGERPEAPSVPALGRMIVGVPDDQDEAKAILESAGSDDLSYSELVAILATLMALDSQECGWCLERVLELLYGPRTPSSHRERYTPRIRAWMRLLTACRWTFDTEAGKPGRKATVTYGGSHDGPLVEVTNLTTGRRGTVHIRPDFKRAMKGSFVAVPAKTFLLPVDEPNPEGNSPSRAVRLRTRLAAAIAGRWRAATQQRVRLQELLDGFAGLDLERPGRRRRRARWFDVLTGDLMGTADRGPGLRERPVRDPQPFATLLRIVLPAWPAKTVRQGGRARQKVFLRPGLQPATGPP